MRVRDRVKVQVRDRVSASATVWFRRHSPMVKQRGVPEKSP